MRSWLTGSLNSINPRLSRFLQPGYRDLESDVDQSRRHHEVRVGKPVPDRGESQNYRTVGCAADI